MVGPRRSRVRPWLTRALAAAAAALLSTAGAHAALIDFSEMASGDRTVATAQGAPPGVTVTLVGFRSISSVADHTPSPFPQRSVYLSAAAGEVNFGAPVEVPSLWVGRSEFASPDDDVVVGTLGGTPVFTFDRPDGVPGWVQVTAGAGLLVDSLRFQGFRESLLDDVTVNVPEPAAAASVLLAAAGARRRRARAATRD